MTKLTLAVISLAMALKAVAQTPEKQEIPPLYHFDLVIKELDAGKQVSSRSYSLNSGIGSVPAYIRVGDKVPFNTKDGGFNFLDVGTNIDCRDVRQRGADLVIRLSAEISIVNTATGSTAYPTIILTRWEGLAVVPLRKPTVVFSSDGASSKRQIQLEITATPLQ